MQIHTFCSDVDKCYKSDQVALHSATQEFHNFSGVRSVTWSQQIHSTHICNGVTAAGCDHTEGERVAYEVIGKGVNPPQDCQALFLHHRFINLPYLLRQNSLQPIFEAYNLGVWGMGFPLLPLHECCPGLSTGADGAPFQVRSVKGLVS